MKLGTANIQNFPDQPRPDVREDARTVRAKVTLGGLQEIQPREDTPVIQAALGHGWWMVGPARETPIVGKHSRWKLLDFHQTAFHRPPLPRPQNRFGAVTSAVVRSVRKPHLPAFAVVNVHLVSGGYNGPKLDVIQDRWRVEWGIYRDEVARLHRQGLTVFTTGDLNNPRPPDMHGPGRFVWLSPKGGPDHIGCMPHERSVQLSKARHDRFPLNSDHDLHRISGPLRHAD